MLISTYGLGRCLGVDYTSVGFTAISRERGGRRQCMHSSHSEVQQADGKWCTVQVPGNWRTPQSFE